MSCSLLNKKQVPPTDRGPNLLCDPSQCDAIKPRCLKCENAGLQCPGYRDLNGLTFRNETVRITKRLHRLRARQSPRAQASLEETSSVPTSEDVAPGVDVLSLNTPQTLMSRPLCLPIQDIAASYFFDHYAVNDHPAAGEYHDWLLESYYATQSNHLLRACIEAVGMARLANLRYAPQISCKASRRYQKALALMRQAINDPSEAVTDVTFVSVILLGSYEVRLSDGQTFMLRSHENREID